MAAITRRKFLKLCGQAALFLGLDVAFLKSAAADGTMPIKFLHRLITAQPTTACTLVWQSTALLACLVEYRKVHAVHDIVQTQHASMTSLCEDQQTNYFHTAALNFLTPDTDYEYRITAENKATQWHRFHTAPKNAEQVKALIFCDSQCGTSYDTWKRTLRAAWDRHPDTHFFAIGGDLTDNGQSDWHWDSFFAAMDGHFAAQPLAPVMGNHECYGLNWKFCLPRRYLHTFSLPNNQSKRLQGYYYSYDYGPVHFIVLNTQMLELKEFVPDLADEQLRWLKQDAKSHSQPWQVVIMHKDILAYGEYQEGTGQCNGISDVGHVFMEAFDALGIDLVLTGHIHTYRNRGHIQGLKSAADGPVYIMSGPVGNQQYTVPLDKDYDRTAIHQPTPENYLTLHATLKKLTVTGYTVDGELIETTSLTK